MVHFLYKLRCYWISYFCKGNGKVLIIGDTIGMIPERQLHQLTNGTQSPFEFLIAISITTPESEHPVPYYSHSEQPSVDPELMIRSFSL